MPAKPNLTFVPRRWRVVIPLSLLALILAHLMASIYRIQPAVSLWFPPSGVAIALTLWLGPIGALFTGIISILMAPLWGSHGWNQLVGITDAVEPLVAWFLYRRCWQGSLSFKRLKDAAAFILGAPLAACLTSAVVGSLTLAFLGKIPFSNVTNSIVHWWLGNAIGTMGVAPTALLVFTPFLQNRGWLPTAGESERVTTPSPPFRLLSRCLTAEVLAILAFSVVTAVLTVLQTHSGSFEFQQLSFLSFVPIIWAATRFSVKGGMVTASFCVLVTLFAYLIIYPYNVSLPFPISPEVLHVHKLSLLVQCAVSLLVGCAIAERWATQEALTVERVQAREYQARAQLTEQLIELNNSLAQSNRDKDELLWREQAARTEAETANRLKDEFLAVLSHELRSPLNPILGWTQILRSRKHDETTTARALETIERNVKLQIQLIDDLLDISRIIRGKLSLNLKPVNLIDIIQAAIETIHLAAQTKTINLKFTISDSRLKTLENNSHSSKLDELPSNPKSKIQNPKFPVLGDATRLQQVVLNLLSNAIKFTPEGGQVEVTLEKFPIENKNIPLSVQSEISNLKSVTSYAQITVSDTGIGIAPDFLPYVFDYFRQADSTTTRKFGGLGLGLAIVHRLVELHGGTVQVESPGEGMGATFIVKLPLLEEPEDS